MDYLERKFLCVETYLKEVAVAIAIFLIVPPLAKLVSLTEDHFPLARQGGEL